MDEQNIIKTTEETFKKEADAIEEPVATESNIYRLDEMIDAIDASMSNIDELCKEQKKLIEILTNVNNSDLDELIKNMTDQVNYLIAQYTELESRKASLNYVLASCKDNEEISTLVDKLLTGLGIFKNK